MSREVVRVLLLAVLASGLLGCSRSTEPVQSREPVPPHRIPKK